MKFVLCSSEEVFVEPIRFGTCAIDRSTAGASKSLTIRHSPAAVAARQIAWVTSKPSGVASANSKYGGLGRKSTDMAVTHFDTTRGSDV